MQILLPEDAFFVNQQCTALVNRGFPSLGLALRDSRGQYSAKKDQINIFRLNMQILLPEDAFFVNQQCTALVNRGFPSLGLALRDSRGQYSAKKDQILLAIGKCSPFRLNQKWQRAAVISRYHRSRVGCVGIPPFENGECLPRDIPSA